MKFHPIPGILALGLAAMTPAVAQKEGAAAPSAPAAPAEKPAAPPVDPVAVKSDSSYALGLRSGGEFGRQYGQFGITAADLDTASFLKGFMAGFKGGKPEIDQEKLAAAMQALGDQLQSREKEMAAKNLAAGKKFLETNGKRNGVTTTKSGLQYEVLAKGGDKKYAEPKEGEPEKQFMVNYKGTLIDGTEFDASPEGQPVPMNMQVIDGFKEALTLMPVGAKWKIFIPSELAYKEQRRSAEIAPNSALIFELELVSIEDAPQHPGGLPFPMPQGGGEPEGVPEGE